ncbi:POMP [Mytilus edulis]|uniref:POMP n=1 Tax=Mytilus edulis TaxID=6550 RepID=A0A8S3RV72_MYTED|nr:POMP [Mytilus edulis]
MANLNYPSMRPSVRGEHTVDIPEGQYGVPNVMLHGLQPGRKLERAVHPLEYSEKHWDENKRTMDFSMLRNTQGLHAPLKLQMEIHTAKHFGRLPCLASSNTMLDTLTGRDDLINFDDIFNRLSTPYWRAIHFEYVAESRNEVGLLIQGFDEGLWRRCINSICADIDLAGRGMKGWWEFNYY